MKKYKLIPLVIIIAFCFMSIKYDRSAEKQIFETEKRTKFVQGLNDWQKILFEEIEKYPKLGDKYKAYHVLRYTIKHESNDYRRLVEVLNGDQISFGLAQISFWVADDYHRAHGKDNFLELRKNKRIHYLFNKQNNIKIFVWNCARYHKDDWRYTLSCHNVGLSGFTRWSKRTGRKYYYPFVDHVRGKMPKEIRGLL